MTTVYRKSSAGQEEVASKAHPLPQRARSLLIMIDGKRSLSDLRAMLGPAVDEGIELLLREGLIKALTDNETAAGAVTAPAPLAAAAPPAPALAPAGDWQAQRRDAARAITDALGPMGDALALRLERTRNADELQAALRMAADALADSAPRAKAEAFRQRFLPG